jgi:hypothetical protein
MRDKYMSNEAAKLIQQHSGQVVELTPQAYPQWATNILSARFFTSGIRNPSEDWVGMEIYRDASNHPEAKSGYPYNKDIYSAEPSKSGSGYIVSGPNHDAEHWTSAISHSGVPIILPE